LSIIEALRKFKQTRNSADDNLFVRLRVDLSVLYAPFIFIFQASPSEDFPVHCCQVWWWTLLWLGKSAFLIWPA